MSNFSIIRTEKIKSIRDLRGHLAHNTRSQNVSNADQERLHLNSIPKSHCTVQKCYERYLAVLGDHKPRKNAVLAREFVITASPEAMNSMSKHEEMSYFKSSLDFVSSQMGGEDNLISLAIHRDESTSHMHLIFACIVDGKLNDRALLGGHKDRLSEFQTDFHNKVGCSYGLKRGIEKSSGRHVPQKEFYGSLQERERNLIDSISKLEKMKLELSRDVVDASKYAFPFLKQRMEGHFKLMLSADGELTGINEGVLPDLEIVSQVEKLDLERVDRTFSPKW